jgi:peptide/nickel transport system substrate-binding protein
VGAHPVPGTGPYRIVGGPSEHVVFARNPYFEEWSHAAQPAGNPDRVVWRYTSSLSSAVRQVHDDRADWVYGLLPPEDMARLRVDDAAQLHSSPSLIVDFIPLNTHTPPFDDVRARRALNYAIDRAKIARMYGGPAAAEPICQPLVPGMLGYRPYCPYTEDPGSGTWTAPDLQRAKRLVLASGTQGERVDVWGAANSVGVPSQEPAYITHVLRTLGYRATLHMVSDAQLDRRRPQIQLSVDGDWLPDYPTPSSLLPPFFGCDGGLTNGYICDRELDREMQTASALGPRGAASRWARIDRHIVDQAYWVPTVQPDEAELVSSRLENYQLSPVWDFIADQAWLR